MEMKYWSLKVVLLMVSFTAVLYFMDRLKPSVKTAPQARSAKMIKLQAPAQLKTLCDDENTQKGLCSK